MRNCARPRRTACGSPFALAPEVQREYNKSVEFPPRRRCLRNRGGTCYEQTGTGRDGGRHGQPLRRHEADRPGGSQRTGHRGLFALRRPPRRLRDRDLCHQARDRGCLQGRHWRPCGQGHEREIRFPAAARRLHRAGRPGQALGHLPRRAGRQGPHRRPLCGDQRR